jgi:hypothetical protein
MQQNMEGVPLRGSDTALECPFMLSPLIRSQKSIHASMLLLYMASLPHGNGPSCPGLLLRIAVRLLQVTAQ